MELSIRKSIIGIQFFIILIFVFSLFGCESNESGIGDTTKKVKTVTGKAATDAVPVINETLGSGNQIRYIKGLAGSRMIYNDSGGQDSYTILPTFCGDVEIKDNDASSVYLSAGLNITSAKFLADRVEFTLNGLTLAFSGNPSAFNFVFAGSSLSTAAGVHKTYAQTAQAFGTTLPASGQPFNSASIIGIINGDGSVQASSEDTTAPSIPTGLSIYNHPSTGQVRMDWNDSTDNIQVAGYKVYRNGVLLKTLTPGLRTGSISETPYRLWDIGLAPSTSYCYTVSSIDTVGNESAQTPEICLKTGDWSSDAENQENYTYKLTQSTGEYTLWTTLPSERVFKSDPVPDSVSSPASSKVLVYAAKNEFEPFQIVIKPAVGVAGSVSVNMGAFGSGIKTEIHQVKYVNITQATDILGKTGDYPDPLWPIENGASVNLAANENTAFWITVHVPGNVPAGEYFADFKINSLANPTSSLTIPVSLHVFNFSIPDEIHTKSQMNFSHNTILDKYGVGCCSADYWMYVDRIKQYFIDHRLTPSSVLWSGGLTSNGGAPYIDYDCASGTFTDNDGIWGFEEPSKRYLDGSGLMRGTFDLEFNEGSGFSTFMALSFQNNDSSADQRPSSFCGQTRTASDWYTAANLDSPYNRAWFSYMTSIESYLSNKGYLDKAYYYMANEPQDQADYDAVAWYSQELKKVAPNLKLMVSEEAKPQIYNHPSYPGAKIDIWLPVLNNYDPVIAHTREHQFNEETWIYWLHGTRPPYFNPITLDHPGIESKLTGWFLWKYRVRGIAYYSLNNWSKNPWTAPMTDGHNGDLFMLYPPSQTNSAIAYGANNHRFVPSLRFELMRDSLEDYEYLYVLNGGKQPVVNSSDLSDAQISATATNLSDIQAAKIISGVASYNRDSNFMYNLRRLIGLKNGGEISEIPDIKPSPSHPRSAGAPGNYYINFQNPQETFSTASYGNPIMKDQVLDGVSYRMLDYDGRTYYAIGPQAYDKNRGYGWFGNIINQPGQSRDPWGSETDERKRTYIYDDYGRVNTFEFALPNGDYEVFLCVGTPRKKYSRNNVRIEGVLFVDDEQNNYFIERSKNVKVSDNSLTIEIGLSGMDEYTMLNYLHIIAKTIP